MYCMYCKCKFFKKFYSNSLKTSDSESVDAEIIDFKKVKTKTPKTLDPDDSHNLIFAYLFSGVFRRGRVNSGTNKKAQIITELREKYHCFLYQFPCIIKDGMHKKLTCAHLELWSTEIIKGFTTIDKPPTYQIFVFDKKKAFLLSIFKSIQADHKLFIHHLIIQITYINIMLQICIKIITPTLVATNTNVNVNNTHINVKENISIQDFFENLDKKFGDKVFSVYLKNFSDQRIEVQNIPELGDEEFLV
ncbi:hypothetical protein GLOIN_2v1486073 [Rhizophagus irregularis DAOM 181602=DAOM 197198]|nr:hypothetical protein GLOIN_2v1486073 [Rhizophagus irregularis DAOM 181602=DAOM 197198]